MIEEKFANAILQQRELQHFELNSRGRRSSDFLNPGFIAVIGHRRPLGRPPFCKGITSKTVGCQEVFGTVPVEFDRTENQTIAIAPRLGRPIRPSKPSGKAFEAILTECREHLLCVSVENGN
jgi:hypothetical protein